MLDPKSSLKLIDTTSFKLRPNPTVANSIEVCHMAWAMKIDLEDDLGSWAQFPKLIKITSFELNQIINTWIFFNTKTAEF